MRDFLDVHPPLAAGGSATASSLTDPHVKHTAKTTMDIYTKYNNKFCVSRLRSTCGRSCFSKGLGLIGPMELSLQRNHSKDYATQSQNNRSRQHSVRVYAITQVRADAFFEHHGDGQHRVSRGSGGDCTSKCPHVAFLIAVALYAIHKELSPPATQCSTDIAAHAVWLHGHRCPCLRFCTKWEHKHV